MTRVTLHLYLILYTHQDDGYIVTLDKVVSKRMGIINPVARKGDIGDFTGER